MRTIKFRGKDIKTKQWVYGYYSCGYREYSYQETEEYKHWIESWNGRSYFISEVDPNTVGQFTGLYDKNGKEIYEGDKVLISPFELDEPSEAIVFYHEKHAVYRAKVDDDLQPVLYAIDTIEVVGNIHD